MMSPQQEDHLKELKLVTTALMEDKYRKGQAEHGGNLFDLSVTDLIDEAIYEAVDQITFLLTAKSKINEVKGNLDFKVRE